MIPSRSDHHSNLRAETEMAEPKEHWETVYRTKAPTEVSWYQAHLEKSLELMLHSGVHKEGNIIDVGAGASTLVDDLLAKGFEHVTVLDISSDAIRSAKSRLGGCANKITWLEGDINKVTLPHHFYDVWYDRALFHFLTSKQDRQRYVEQARRSLKGNGHLIMATFALTGPPRCSGLDVVRYSPESILAELGRDFILLDALNETHATPFDTKQEFIYCHFRKNPNAENN